MVIGRNLLGIRRRGPFLRSLLLGAGLLALAGCNPSSENAPVQDELLLVYSGDFRGFYEPCG